MIGFLMGKEFEFPLTKAEPIDEEIDPSVYGYFTRGDTVTLKWSTIDQDHFQFLEHIGI